MSETDTGGLFPAPKPKQIFGPVYQGVSKQIRALIADGTLDKKKHAGTIAQARSLAASIDRDSGHDGGRQANGVPLAALHQQLDALVERMTAGVTESDPFQDLLDQLDAEGSATHGPPAPPHTAQP